MSIRSISFGATIVACACAALMVLFAIPADAAVVEVSMTARQWEFEPSTVTVEEGDVVTMTILSEDVDHGFFLNAFGVDSSLRAGTTTTVSFTADTAGTYSFSCNVFCGAGHGSMSGTLVVTDVAEEVVDEEEVDKKEEEEEIDSAAPVISGVSISNIQQTSAQIHFTANEASFGQIEYGINPGVYVAATPLAENTSTSHSGVLTGLSAGTTYYYRAKAHDATGNYGFSTESTFATEAIPEPEVSVIETSVDSTEAIEISTTDEGVSVEEEREADVRTEEDENVEVVEEIAPTMAEPEEPLVTVGTDIINELSETAVEDESALHSTGTVLAIVMGIIALIVIVGIYVVRMNARS